MKIPSIPQDAPYSDMQRAWLSGFFAGLHTHMVQSVASGASRTARTVHVFYGSQTGNAEAVARDAAAFARKQGLNVVLKGMDEVDIDVFASIQYLLVITSTYGEGEMPDNAAPLWQAINSDSAPSLVQLRYAVLALGDTSYDKFCQAGIDWDLRLEALGAQRLHPRVDCDVDFEEPAQAWIDSILPLLAEGVTLTTAVEELVEKLAPSSQYSRKNPFPARLLVNRLLSGARSTKEIRHYELSLEGSGLRYEAGDALGVAHVLLAAHLPGQDEPAEVLGSEGTNGQIGGERAVDPTRKPQDRADIGATEAGPAVVLLVVGHLQSLSLYSSQSSYSSTGSRTSSGSGLRHP